MSETKPLVSILTPSLNQGRWLDDCIRSVARQTYRPLEHVVCDGGSTDGSAEILRRAPEHVRWTIEPDGGQADALNKAFARSRGDIVGWLNSDDALFAVDAITRVVDGFAADPTLDAIVGGTAIAREDGRLVRAYHSYLPRRRRLPRRSSPISQPAFFVRRRAIREGELFVRPELEVTLDLELVLRLLRRGARIGRTSRVLALDRDHGDRKMRLLKETFDAEAAGLRHEYGYAVDPSLLERALAWQRRWRGLPAVLSWPRYEPASDWHLDSVMNRVARQIAVPHFRALDR